jgi:hypothetical protein
VSFSAAGELANLFKTWSAVFSKLYIIDSN